MKTNGLLVKSWEQRSCVGLEGEEVAGQMDAEGRDNLEAPLLMCYIAILIYIFK
jgi:hypothetical protein